MVLFAADSNFKQQRLKAWQPILTASTALPLFFIIGIVFIPIGAILLVASDKVSMNSYVTVTFASENCICGMHNVRIDRQVSLFVYLHCQGDLSTEAG